MLSTHFSHYHDNHGKSSPKKDTKNAFNGFWEKILQTEDVKLHSKWCNVIKSFSMYSPLNTSLKRFLMQSASPYIKEIKIRIRSFSIMKHSFLKSRAQNHIS